MNASGAFIGWQMAMNMLVQWKHEKFFYVSNHPNFFFFFSSSSICRLFHFCSLFFYESRVPSLLVNRCKIADTETSYILVEAARSLAELYDARREKPSVLVTSPGSPDLHAQGRGRHSRHPIGNANVGGSIQVKLGFDPMGLQLIVTIICAAGLTPKSNGQLRNPYAKVFLLPDKRWEMEVNQRT